MAVAQMVAVSLDCCVPPPPLASLLAPLPCLSTRELQTAKLCLRNWIIVQMVVP